MPPTREVRVTDLKLRPDVKRSVDRLHKTVSDKGFHPSGYIGYDAAHSGMSWEEAERLSRQIHEQVGAGDVDARVRGDMGLYDAATKAMKGHVEMKRRDLRRKVLRQDFRHQ